MGVQIVAMVITMHIPELQRREDGLLEDCLAHLDDSLQDPCYAARRHAALTVPSLYVGLAGRYAHPSGSRAEVLRVLHDSAHDVLCWQMFTSLAGCRALLRVASLVSLGASARNFGVSAACL